jgi:hypothetical protein
VLEANDLRMAGKAGQAVARLEPLIDGSEPFQAHAALLDAYKAVGNEEKALAQATWLAGHRGRAYSELGCSWCQQALNVVDTTLGRLLAAELLVSMGRSAEARDQLQKFDKQWSTADLPDHLRVRRTELLAAFN